MIITFNAGRYVADHLPEYAKGGPGWRQDSATKEWYALDPRVVLPLRAHCDVSANKELNRTFLAVTPWTGALPHPPELTPRPFQKYSALFALSRNRSYLALDMGCGKGVIAVLIANALRKSVLYICPPYLAETVAEEFRKWGVGLRVDTSVTHFPPFATPTVWVVPDSQIHSVHLREAVGQWVRLRSPALIVDEAHRFNHIEARRTRALFQAFVPAFRRVVFMSGTPCPSRPMELWPVLSECAPETVDFMTESDFGRRYCGGHYSEQKRAWDFSRASNVDELAEKIHGTFMLRLRKDDVLPELPPKTEELVVIGGALPPVLADMDAGVLRVIGGVDDLVGRELATRAGLSEEQELALSTYRRELETLKASASLRFIRGVLENSDENLLVVGYHKEALALLVKGLAPYHPLVITGSTPMDVRHARVKAFQSEPDRRVFIVNYIAGGTGYTLTKATRVIMVGFSWVPGENDQVSDRTHRIGQLSNVLVQYLVFRDSVDCKVIQVIQRKRQTTRRL